ncbi:hypothetical protein WUBG_10424 [Wuchereria bancrofti]|uniref:Uncharacterized protein n=1 Tax=Wuchereria bancrofti TaxID=6293 RepID=J9AVW3_WUCBA|nr:hypothetical protein WUBG_10424 [Wuchereria bancrofti]
MTGRGNAIEREETKRGRGRRRRKRGEGKEEEEEEEVEKKKDNNDDNNDSGDEDNDKYERMKKKGDLGDCCGNMNCHPRKSPPIIIIKQQNDIRKRKMMNPGGKRGEGMMIDGEKWRMGRILY